MIRPNQIYASDMRLLVSLIANDRTEHTSHKHEKIFVDNAAVHFRFFCENSVTWQLHLRTLSFPP